MHMFERTKVILEGANAAIAEGNYEAFLAFYADDTHWTFVGDKTLQGREAVRQWMATEYVDQAAREFAMSRPPLALIGVDMLFEEGIVIEAEVTAMISRIAPSESATEECE